MNFSQEVLWAGVAVVHGANVTSRARPRTDSRTDVLSNLGVVRVGAGEVVRFQDGRYLKVEGHQVHGEAVKLMMANRSVLVLPLNRIDTIRSGDVVVYAAGISWTTSPQELQAVALKPRRNLPETPDRERG